MAGAYPRDMSHSNWTEVFARQALRAELMADWFDAIGIKPGDRVLDVGAGPGYVSLALAELVGRDGVVVAIDRSADALAYLAELQQARGVAQSHASRRTQRRSRWLDRRPMRPWSRWCCTTAIRRRRSCTSSIGCCGPAPAS